MPSVKALLYRPIGILKTFLTALRRSKRSNGTPRVFLLNVPSHGNLGDHLISLAEQEFLRDNVSEREVVLITSAELYFSISCALWDVHNNDILCVTGGGFMGSLYDEENRFLKIIRRYPNNKIIFFPQTIYYTATKKGEKQKIKAAKIYNKHRALYVAARDQSTYDLLINQLMPAAKDRVLLVPDMALYKYLPLEQERKGVMWCLRQDLERKALNNSILKQIRLRIEEIITEQKFADTYVSHAISIDNESKEVTKFAKQLSSVQLVITDRLHGMIFSVITNTPVIAIDNSNGKIGQSYKLWLIEMPFVRYVESISSVDSAITDLLNNPCDSYNPDLFRLRYQPLIDAISNEI